MLSIRSVYTLKGDKKTKNPYGPLDVYLGTKIQELRHPDANEYEPHCWSMFGDQYDKKIISNV